MKKNGKLQGVLRTIGEYALSVGVFIAIWWIYVAVKHSAIAAESMEQSGKNVCKGNGLSPSLDDNI
jgi:hypothetical protein